MARYEVGSTSFPVQMSDICCDIVHLGRRAAPAYDISEWEKVSTAGKHLPSTEIHSQTASPQQPERSPTPEKITTTGT
jgi:hypothetical protein